MSYSDRQRLADLEELSLTIPNQAERQYFNEAVQCYFSGALRAAVILAWVVATDNLMSKLDLLAKEDGEAAKRFGAIDAKRKSDQTYEEDLLNSFGPGALDVFTKRELDQLQYVREKRHWCAHATDYRPTPEEARNCLRLVVDIALSKPIYRGFAFIKQLESDVKDPAFLPARGYVSVVANYLSKLRPALHILVVRKLIDVALDPAATSPTKENVRRFVGGVLEQTTDEMQLQAVAKELPRVIAASPELAHGIVAHRTGVYQHLEFESRERLFRSVLESDLSDEDQELLVAFMRTEVSIGGHVEALTEQLKDKILSTPRLVKQHPAELARPAFDVTVTKLEYLGPGNFAINNPAAAFLSAVGFETFDGLITADKERLVRALVKSAIDAAHTPAALIYGAKGWPEGWLELLVKGIPKIITETGLTTTDRKLVTAPLEAWANRGKALPDEWLPLLAPPPAGPHISWYVYADEALLDGMGAVERALTSKGNTSPELSGFVQRVKEELDQRDDGIPF